MTKYRESARIAELISRLLTQTISSEEEVELAAHLKDNGLNNEEMLEKFIRQDFDAREDDAEKAMTDEVWGRVKKQIHAPAKPRKRRYIRIAAAAAVIIGAVVALYYTSRDMRDGQVSDIKLAVYEPVLEFPDGEVRTIVAEAAVKDMIDQKTEVPQDASLTISVPKGMMYTFNMDDGTTIHLFPETQLRFPKSFNGSTREVFLSGEAFFDVARDDDKPFLVNAGGASIEVLGTSFNVKAYGNQSNVETVLVSGSVDVNGHILEPNQLAIVTRTDGKVDIMPVNGEIYSARAAGEWVFDYLPLNDIMQELSRWFEFDYEFADQSLMEKRFRFKLPNNSDFSRISELMEKTGELKFAIKGNKIVISQ